MNGEYLISASLKDAFRIWDIDTGKLLRKLSRPGLWVNEIALSPNGKFFVFQVHEDTVEIRNTVTNRPIAAIDKRLSFGIMTTFLLSPDARNLILGTGSGKIQLTRLSPQYKQLFHLPPGSLLSLPSHAKIDIGELWSKLSHRKGILDSGDQARDWTGYIERGDPIGGGGFSDVFEVKWINFPYIPPDKLPRAVVKTLRVTLAEASKREKTARIMKREIEVWMSLGHPNVVPFVGIVRLEAEIPSLVSLYMPNGKLHDLSNATHCDLSHRHVKKVSIRAPRGIRWSDASPDS